MGVVSAAAVRQHGWLRHAIPIRMRLLQHLQKKRKSLVGLLPTNLRLKRSLYLFT